MASVRAELIKLIFHYYNMKFKLSELEKFNCSGKRISFISQDEIFDYILQGLNPKAIKGVSNRSVYYWKCKQRPIPLKYLFDICKEENINSINVKSIHVNGGNFICLPCIKNPKLFYLLGLILGDGCLSISKKSSNRRSFHLQISFKSKHTAYKTKKLVKKLFQIESSVYLGDGCYNVCTFSKCLIILLNTKFDVPIGEKYDLLRVPYIVMRNRKVIPFFIKGLFDSDGNIYQHRGKPAIQLRQKSRSFLVGVKDLLLCVGISIGGPYYDKANNSWLLWSSKISSVDRFIKDINSLKYTDP
jgi:hypothetical protein